MPSYRFVALCWNFLAFNTDAENGNSLHCLLRCPARSFTWSKLCLTCRCTMIEGRFSNSDLFIIYFVFLATLVVRY